MKLPIATRRGVVRQTVRERGLRNPFPRLTVRELGR